MASRGCAAGGGTFGRFRSHFGKMEPAANPGGPKRRRLRLRNASWGRWAGEKHGTERHGTWTDKGSGGGGRKDSRKGRRGRKEGNVTEDDMSGTLSPSLPSKTNFHVLGEGRPPPLPRTMLKGGLRCRFCFSREGRMPVCRPSIVRGAGGAVRGVGS
jgi:hypothetical protein